MNLDQFSSRNRRRRHRAGDLGHAGPVDERGNAEVVAEMATIVDKIATDAAIKGAVFTSGKDGFSGGADLTMLEDGGRRIRPSRQGGGRRGGDARFRRLGRSSCR